MRILLLADLHAGSTVAPWPNVHLPEGALWRPGKAQRWLNRCWDGMLEHLLEIPRLDAVVFMGDSIEGTHPRDAGLITNRLDHQVEAAVELLSPVRELTDRFYMIGGTNWHVGKGAEYETQIADQLGAVEHPETKSRVWPFLMLKTNAGSIHFAHHIGFTSNVMYEPNALWRALVNLRMEVQKAYGRLAPDVTCIVRAHRHRMMHVEKGNWHGVSVPCWQLKTDYAHKAAVESMPEIGYIVMDIDECIDVHGTTFTLPTLHQESL